MDKKTITIREAIRQVEENGTKVKEEIDPQQREALNLNILRKINEEDRTKITQKEILLTEKQKKSLIEYSHTHWCKYGVKLFQYVLDNKPLDAFAIYYANMVGHDTPTYEWEMCLPHDELVYIIGDFVTLK